MTRIWIVTHNDRYGVANWLFSSEEKASAFHDRLMRERWNSVSSEPCPDNAQEMYDVFAEYVNDEYIEIDHAIVDEACAPA